MLQLTLAYTKVEEGHQISYRAYNEMERDTFNYTPATSACEENGYCQQMLQLAVAYTRVERDIISYRAYNKMERDTFSYRPATNACEENG